MSIFRHANLLLIAVLCAVFACAGAVSESGGDFGVRVRHRADSDKARMLGRMMHVRLTVDFENVPARDAFAAIAEVLDLNLIGRWSDDKAEHGIDPHLPLTLRAEARPAIDVIEELLEQCEDYEQCTWQLRSSFVEVGTKRRLAAAGARERVVYDVSELLLEPPYFSRNVPGSGRRLKNDSPYVDAVLGEENRYAIRNGAFPRRKSKHDILLEIGEALVEIIESGRWDLGQDDARPDAVSEGQTTRPETPAEARSRREHRYWATLRIFQEALIITAPDFMHRQIGGYPTPIKPLDSEQLRVVPTPVPKDR